MKDDVCSYIGVESVSIKINRKDLLRMIKIKKGIRLRLENKEPVSADLFNKLFSYFDVEKHFYNDNIKVSMKVIKNTIDFFCSSSTNKFYWFGNKYIPLNDLGENEFDFGFLEPQYTYNFETFIQKVYSDTKIDKRVKRTTKSVLKEVYKNVESISNEYIKNNPPFKPYTHYQITVISAVITSSLGFKFNRESKFIEGDLSTADWYDMAKDMVSDFKSKNPQTK